MEEELADVLILATMLAHGLGLDPETIMRAKLAVNERKYPVEKAYGRKDKYTQL